VVGSEHGLLIDVYWW